MASLLPPDPYERLGVSKDAKLSEIRSAHRKLVLKCHPDRVQDVALKALNLDEFQKVQQAYELLCDDARRAQYDNQVKLFELRKEMGRDNLTPRSNPFRYEIKTAEPRPRPVNRPLSNAYIPHPSPEISGEPLRGAKKSASYTPSRPRMYGGPSRHPRKSASYTPHVRERESMRDEETPRDIPGKERRTQERKKQSSYVTDKDNRYEVDKKQGFERNKSSRTADVEEVSFASDSYCPQQETTIRPAVSRKSSVDSLASDSLSIFSTQSSANTSLSSFETPVNLSERLSFLLWADAELRGLIQAALQKTTPDLCEQQFRHSLIRFSKYLRYQALTLEERQVARVVKYSASNTAHLIRGMAISQEGQEALPSYIMNGAPMESENKENDGEEGSDEEGFENDPGEDIIDFQRLETFLITSSAFQMLRDGMRLFVYPDPVLKAIMEAWPLSQARSAAFSIQYDMLWQLPRFLKNSFVKGQCLGDVLTLTGNHEVGTGALNAQATCCRDYLSATWPDIGLFILNGVETMLSVPESVVIKQNQTEIELQCEVDNTKEDFLSTAKLTVKATYEVQGQIASALLWLCAAIRHSSHPGLASSSATIICHNNSTSGKRVSLYLNELNPIAGHSCWHALFQHAVIVDGFPICDREEGKGLRLSFVDMVNLARSLAFVEVNGGLVLDGLVTLLYPVRVLGKDRAIQWHLELKGSESIQDEISAGTHPMQIMAERGCQNWYKELNAEKLASSPVFLGWTKNAHMVLGTQSTSPLDVQVSGAFDSDPTRILKTYGGNAGIGIHGIAALSVTASTTRSAVASGISGIENREDDGVKQILVNGIANHVIIYDDDEDTGWLIPQTTLYLYLAQIFFLRKRGGSKSLPNEIYSMPAADGGEAAFATISRLFNPSFEWSVTAQLAESGLVSDGEAEKDRFPRPAKFLDWIKLTCHRLCLISHELRQIYTDAKKAGPVAPDSILGVELVDVALMEESMPVKRSRVENPWAHLAEHQPCIVLFCKKLGHAIVPSSLEGLCSPWSSVPGGNKYLVATSPSIIHLLKKRTRKRVPRLADHISWSFQAQMIQLHQPGAETLCCHLQFLRSELPSQDQKGLTEAVTACGNGAFIFTNSSQLKKFWKLKPITLERQYAVVPTVARQPGIQKGVETKRKSENQPHIQFLDYLASHDGENKLFQPDFRSLSPDKEANALGCDIPISGSQAIDRTYDISHEALPRMPRIHTNQDMEGDSHCQIVVGTAQESETPEFQPIFDFHSEKLSSKEILDSRALPKKTIACDINKEVYARNKVAKHIERTSNVIKRVQGREQLRILE